MSVKNERANRSAGVMKELKAHTQEVVLEISDSNNTGKYIISYGEWLLIREWYCDSSATDDYLLTIKNSAEPYTIVRLDKKLPVIKVWGLDSATVYVKNLFAILLCRVPGIIRFSTAFFISLALWAVFLVIALVKGAEITADLASPMLKLTAAVFAVFFLLNLQCAVFKAIGCARNKLRVFIDENETRFTESLAFNFVLLAIFSLFNPMDIVMFFAKIFGLLS